MEYGLTIVLYIFVAWMTISVQSDCCIENPKVPTFQTCQYRCHCKNDTQCDEISGDCPNGCERGWMGPRCQYRNLAVSLYSLTEYTLCTDHSNHPDDDKDEERSWSPKFDDVKCHDSVIVHFLKPCEVLGLIIEVPSGDVGKHFFRIETMDDAYDEQFPTTCYEGSYINKTMEIMCRQSKIASVLQITLNWQYVHVCAWEVKIYGGRSLAFNKPSEEESTDMNPRRKVIESACFAVDGLEHSLHVIPSTEDSIKPWWRVDLLHQYSLNEMVYHCTGNKTATCKQPKYLRGLHLLYGSNVSSLTTVYRYDALDGHRQPDGRIQISPKVTGRYLQIEHRRNTTLTLSEVLVFGECPLDKCGFNCSLDCFCSTEVTGSYRENGICPYGCQDGWTGVDQRCDRKIGLSSGHLSSSTSCVSCVSSTVGVGVTMAIIIAVMIAVIIILIYRQNKYKRDQEQRVTYTTVNHADTPRTETMYDQLGQEPEPAQAIPVYMDLQ